MQDKAPAAFLEDEVNIRPAVLIRKATNSDSEGILCCLRDSFEPLRASYTPDAFLDTVLTPATVRQRLADMTVLVAIDAEGEVIGTISYALLSRDEGHIRGMAVRPDWQRFGVAQRLLVS